MKRIIRTWNKTSLIKRITIGVIVGLLLGLLLPKVSKTSYKLPKQVLKIIGTTSKKVMRAPKRMIMSIKDFLD